jgi:penicillin amidase
VGDSDVKRDAEPFWGAGHSDWVQHKPTSFLPGKTVYTLTLKSK